MPVWINSYWFLWSLAAYAVIVLSVVGVVLSENRNPVKSLAWVTVLLLLPIGGVVLYLFFGRSIRGAHMISRRKRRKLHESESQLPEPDIEPSQLDDDERQLMALGRSLCGAHIFGDSRVELFADGEEKFARFKADLRAARQFIHLQYYIFEEDAIGREIAEILMERARAGVKVRVIYDHIGSLHVSRRFWAQMREAGVEVYPFFRVAFPVFASRINWRNHRKVTVIDGLVGYVGGMNVADRYIQGPAHGKVWRDAHMRVTGSGVAPLHFSFAVDWHFMGHGTVDTLHVTRPAAPGAPGLPALMQFVTGGPTAEWNNVAMVLFKAIGMARRRVLIQTPYFLPPESMLKALQTAALARVDVRLMIPRRCDSLMLTHAGRSYIHECLRAGIKVYMFEPGMLHSKVVVVDNEFASVGSANIDFRSFEHNFEGNMVMYSREVNAALRRQFADDLRHCTRVRLQDWRRRPLHHKVMQSVLRLLSPIL